MKVEHLEVLVEEPSMEMALRGLLPKIVGNTSFEIHAHQGKRALLARLPNRLRGYAHWLGPSVRIFVIVDRDNDDCAELKRQLEEHASDAKLLTRAQSRGKPYQVVNRIAVEELEAWYFGDWEAVLASYPGVPSTIPTKQKYRSPDTIVNAWEAFERVLQHAGYFEQGFTKIAAARTISAQMVPERNTSRSFQALRNALVESVRST